MDWREKAKELYAKGFKVVEIVKQCEPTMNMEHKRAYNLVKKYIYRHLKGKLAPDQPINFINKKHSVSYKNGITEYNDERPYDKEVTPISIMAEHNLNPIEWEVVSFISNYWQSQTKGGGVLDLCQSKLAVKPKIKSGITFWDIDNYFDNKDLETKIPLKPFEYNADGEILEIVYTDPHIGLLAWREETGADFDLNIIERYFLESIADIVRRCIGRKFKYMRFVTLGDILHIDNDKQETTKGTFQQADGRTAKIFDKAVDILIKSIDCLLELKVPIEYVYISGNHDRETGYYLAKSLQLAYRRETNISFDISPNPQKAKMYGKNLVGYCHGDMPRKNIGTWLLKTFKELYGKCKYAEIHSGHIHTKTEEEINGIKVITLNALCESSYWEHQQGYTSERALICYVWHEEKGKRETWITNF